MVSDTGLLVCLKVSGASREQRCPCPLGHHLGTCTEVLTLRLAGLGTDGPLPPSISPAQPLHQLFP